VVAEEMLDLYSESTTAAAELIDWCDGHTAPEA
jgi:hypothetical protein